MNGMKVSTVVVFVLIGGSVFAERPVQQDNRIYQDSFAVGQLENGDRSKSIRTLTYYDERTVFNAAFPGLPTEDFGGTSVAPGTLVECDVPFNSATNNACFAPGAIMEGVEFDVNQVSPSGTGVVVGTGYLGNTNVWLGANAFADDVVLRFSPAVRAVGFDLVNHVSSPQSHSVEIYGPSGWLGSTPVVDSGTEGNFWGVDADHGGGITSIVFNNGGSTDHVDLILRVVFGGTPVSTDFLTFHSDRASFNAAFPGLPTEDFAGTSVAAGTLAECDVPFNSSTNNACFAPGAIREGIEFDLKQIAGDGTGVVAGIGYLGNAHVWIGANAFSDDVKLKFDPAVRAVGFDLVNPISSPEDHSVEIFGPSGWLGITTVVDSDTEGTFWGVDADDEGGITGIEFNNAFSTEHQEMLLLVTYGGTPGESIFFDGFQSGDLSGWSASSP